MALPLPAAVLDRQGAISLLIGLNTAVQPAATLAIAPFAPRIIRAVGPARVMIYATVMAATVFLLLGLFPDVYVWFQLRFLLGAAGSFLWKIGRAHVCTPVTNAHLVCRLLLEKKKQKCT